MRNIRFTTFIYEARSQVGICERYWTTLFEDFQAHMSQSVEASLDVVETWLIVRLKAEDPYF